MTSPARSDAARTRVLMIDDDRKLCRLIQTYLEPMGFAVTSAHTGPEGLERAREETFDAIILDGMLPGLDGFEVLKELRKVRETPLLMLTARGDEADRIVGLELGADDYLPKTFSTRELLARLRAITRRRARVDETPNAEIAIGPLRIDLDARVVLLDSVPLALTPVEFDFLAVLARAPGRIRTRDQLLEEIRDRNYEVFDRSVDVHISALRRKLNDDPKQPRFIQTVRSAGYMLRRPEG
ncbi:MAG TPA: response regulator transcription factor [Chthoniobacterales bacterium]|nr:response regulator transcription factor [Chthoniobacterales bacterium]